MSYVKVLPNYYDTFQINLFWRILRNFKHIWLSVANFVSVSTWMNALCSGSKASSMIVSLRGCYLELKYRKNIKNFNLHILPFGDFLPIIRERQLQSDRNSSDIVIICLSVMDRRNYLPILLHALCRHFGNKWIINPAKSGLWPYNTVVYYRLCWTAV